MKYVKLLMMTAVFAVFAAEAENINWQPKRANRPYQKVRTRIEAEGRHSRAKRRPLGEQTTQFDKARHERQDRNKKVG